MRQAAQAKNANQVVTQVVLSGEDEKFDDEASKLIVSVQKSQSHGSTSTQTNSGEKSAESQQQEMVNGAASSNHKAGVIPFSDADEPESLLLRREE